MQEIKNIMLRDIVPNPLNKSRSMDYNEIENLKHQFEDRNSITLSSKIIDN